jgi:hypothetical protein
VEQLLFILFLLFSVGSALLERRKRAKQLEESQQRDDEQQRRQASEPASAPLVVDEDEEDWGGWPFPAGGDPFEQPRPRTEPPPVQRQAPQPAESDIDVVVSDQGAAPIADMQGMLQEIERRSLVAEDRAREEEARASQTALQVRRIAKTPQRIAKTPQRVGELIQQNLSRPKSTKRGTVERRWQMTPERARRAIIYAEILGPCKAQQDDNQDQKSS